MRNTLPGKRRRKIGAEQFQASSIDDIERKIVTGNVRGAAAKAGTVAIGIDLVESAAGNSCWLDAVPASLESNNPN